MLFNIRNITAIKREATGNAYQEPAYAVYTTGNHLPFYVSIEEGLKLMESVQMMIKKDLL